MADTRAKKSGIGLEIQKKMEHRYDQEEQAGTTEAVRLWINALMEGESGFTPIQTCSHKDLHHAVMNGAVLCRMINKLLKNDGQPPVHVQNKANTMFPAMTNIENYNKGCVNYGLAKEFLVQSADVWEGQKSCFLNVINNLHSLGFLANSKGNPAVSTYTGEVQKTVDYD
ncbi:hypothetical protein ACOMHN_059804 [Nucella lapillus]